jgi:Na+/melibiose symporter-like transporter
VGAAALLALFVAVESQASSPLFLRTFVRNGQFLWTSLALLAYFGGYTAFQFVATLFLQQALAWSPLHTAAAFVPAGVTVMALSGRVDTFASRWGRSRVTLVGLVAMLVACGWFLLLMSGASSFAWLVLPPVLLIGVATSLAFPCLLATGISRVRRSEQGVAAGFLTAAMQVGAALVLGLSSLVMDPSEPGVSMHSLADYRRGIACATAVTALGVVAGVASMFSDRCMRCEAGR